jgi:hypothetical protein
MKSKELRVVNTGIIILIFLIVVLSISAAIASSIEKNSVCTAPVQPLKIPLNDNPDEGISPGGAIDVYTGIAPPLKIPSSDSYTGTIPPLKLPVDNL